MDGITFPASHVRALKSTLRKTGTTQITLKHDAEDCTTTFAGESQAGKRTTSGRIVGPDAKVSLSKQAAAKRAQALAKQADKAAKVADADPDDDDGTTPAETGGGEDE